MNNEAKYVAAFKDYLVGDAQQDGEWRAYCPLHEDPQQSKSPSASINFKDDVWHCMSCSKGGSVRSLYRTMKEHKGMKAPKRDDNVVDIKTGKPPREMPSKKQLRHWHQRLMSNGSALAFMKDKRGLSEETLKKYMVGYDGQRFTIPIYDEDGNLVNIRRYKPNAKSHADKMVSWGFGTGTGRIYGFETLRANDEVIISEGELDRLISLQHGLPVVTHTAGAAVFKAEWAIHFKDKDVYLAYDEDSSGDTGAMKAAQILKQTARSVWRLKLGTGIKGGDLTDFFVKLGGSADDILLKMGEAKPLFVREDAHVVPLRGRPVSVEESQNPAYGKEPLELTVMVSGKRTPPYVAPRKLKATCDQSAGAPCTVCPLAVNDGERTVTLQSDDERLLKYIDIRENSKMDLDRRIVEARCKSHVDVVAEEEFAIEELVVTPSVSHRSENVETPITRTVFNVSTYKTPVNQLARIVGKQVADPRNQRGVILGWHVEPVNIDIDNFKMTPELREELLVFRNEYGQSPLDKCFEIAQDLAANVTHIYGRPLLHTAYDLVWHSLVGFKFGGKEVTKGWLECLIIGDTRTGKSEASTRLIDHYGAGVITSCESVTFAGLVGGASQPDGKGWMVTWGLLPLNDRRLVVLDEMSGLFSNSNGKRDSKGIIESMSSIRSEGKAQIQKMGKDETSARTRLVWISNPLDDQRLSETPGSALSAVKTLVRSPEDIARFDFIMAAANNEVSSTVINSPKHKRVKHVYKEELCRALVMWAWSRRSDQVRWAKGAEDAVFKAAEDLGNRYVPDPPLVQVENVRMKVARIAVALAARTFSTNASGEVVLVKVQHVKAAVEFLDMVYGTDAMGYSHHSRKVLDDRRRAQEGMDEAREYLKNNPHLVDVFQAVGTTSFRPRDFEEIGGLDRTDAQVIIPKFRQWRMIRRGSQGRLRMEPALVQLIRELEDSE